MIHHQRTLSALAYASLVVLIMGSVLYAKPVVSGDSVHGQWWTPGFASRVEMVNCHEGLCGKIVWLWDNRSAELNQTVLSGFRQTSSQRWTGGTAFNPADGNTYRATLKLIDDATMLVTGCVLLFCKEQMWLRVESVGVVPTAAARSLSVRALD